MTHWKYKRLWISFMQYLNQIARDAMLFLSCLAPVLYGLFVKFGIPSAEKFLGGYYSRTEVLVPYFLVFDLFLAVLTPMMFSFASSMVILGEIDDGITKYMSVTPLGRGGYLTSRLVFPLTFSFVVSIIVMNVFSLTLIPFEMIIALSFLSSVLGYITTMMVVSFSANKVEGMAVTKMSGISMIGVLLPFFVTAKIQYLAIILPSFWMARYAIDGRITYLILCLIVSAVWVMFLFKKFMKKII